MPRKTNKIGFRAGIWILLCLGMSMMPAPLYADDYVFVSEVFNTFDYKDASTGGTLLELGDNAVSAEIDLGFDFTFYDQVYSKVFIGSNGIIGFVPDGLTASSPSIPDSSAPNAVIAPLSMDFDPSKGGSIFYRSGGIQGERYFVVEWSGVPVKDKGGSFRFQVVLFQNKPEFPDNFDILFQYKTLRGGQAIDATTATVGIENQDGTKSLPDVTAGVSLDLSEIKEGKSVLFSVDPWDGDGDEMLDRFKSFYGLTDAQADPDGDDLSNLGEYLAGTRPDSPDTDGDGVNDGTEFGDNPVSPRDSDQDGIPDARETDSDNDGLGDGRETGETNKTDPSKVDTDDDGYNDAMEITFGGDPLISSSFDFLSYTKVTGTIQDSINSASPGDILYIPAKIDPDTLKAVSYLEDLTIDKGITLIGADPDSTFLEGRITISGVDGVVLSGFTIQEDDPAVAAVEILGDSTSATRANLVNMTLKNCVNGVRVNDASGQVEDVTMDRLTFSVTQPMPVGYAIRVEGLQDAGDRVRVNHSSISLTGHSDGAVVIQGSKGVILNSCTISSSLGDGIRVQGDGSEAVLQRNTISGNSGNGIQVADASIVTIADSSISSNKECGIKSGPGSTVTLSGNLVTSNSGDAANCPLDTSGSPASGTGAVANEDVAFQSAARILKNSGGETAVLDPTLSLFGASIRFPAGALTQDTLVSLGVSSEALPGLPIVPYWTMPVVTVLLDPGPSLESNAAATVTLPVLAGYDAGTARVFYLGAGGQWIEAPSVQPLRHSTVEPSLPQRVSFGFGVTDSGPYRFVAVIDLPLIEVDRKMDGGGCAVRKQGVWSGQGECSLDPFLLALPILLWMIRKPKVRPR